MYIKVAVIQLTYSRSSVIMATFKACFKFRVEHFSADTKETK